MTPRNSFVRKIIFLALTFALIALATFFAPAEKTLGSNARLVYLHGAWVWAGLISFAAAALCGAAGLLARRNNLHAWSAACAKTGLVFWWSYLPMSLLVMQLNWGGLFLDEPRWKIPFAFGIAGLALQVGLALINRAAITSAANLVYAIALWVALAGAVNILHPDSPIQGAPVSIQLFFALLLVLAVLFGVQVALFWRGKAAPTR